MVRLHVISGIFWRNVKSYFSGVLGYLIIVAFVTICAILAFSQTFFANNYASLDELSKVYGWLLLFLIPAITMGAWSEEHRSGTDVLLFTLPANTWEILLGKYFAVCAVYTIALLFSVTQLFALYLLGDPDWSVVLSTYYGFWIAGLALLSVGLFASSLTHDSAVAFVLGMLLCAIPVLGNYFIQGQQWLDSLTIQSHLDQFSSGVISLSSIFYFGSIKLLFLYLNHVVISKRLWVRYGDQFMTTNYVARSISLCAFLAAGYFLLDRISGNFPTYLDLTAENLYTLDKTTTQAIAVAAKNNTKVTIEAYVSEEVPADYVPVKKQMLTLLSQYDRLGGGNIVLKNVSVRPTSEEATQAQAVGIEPVVSQTIVGGKNVEQEVFLGAVIKTANGESVLPMFNGKDSIEYEITRAIAALSEKETKLTLGVLETDLHFAGLDIQGQVYDLSFGKAKKQLEKFYKLRRVNYLLLKDYTDWLQSSLTDAQKANLGILPVEISAERKKLLEKTKLPDVLMVAGVSSLDQPTMDQLVNYIKFGKAVLLMDDPVPFMWPTYISAGQLGLTRGPGQPRISPQAPFSALNAYPGPKSSLNSLEQALGIDWNPTRIVRNSTSEPDSFVFPMLQMPMSDSTAWPEGYGGRQNALVFFRNSHDSAAFNPENPASAGLREVLMMYCGTFGKSVNSPFDFQPLVSTHVESAELDYDQYSQNAQTLIPSWDPDLNRQVVRKQDQTNQYTGMPERVLKSSAGPVSQEAASHVVAAIISGDDSQPRNVIVIADTDFVTDLAFECDESLKTGLDNLQLLQNSIETLASEDAFIQLRSRRHQLRPLVKIDNVKRAARRERLTEQAMLEDDLQIRLADAQAKLNEKTKQLQENKDLSFMQRLQLTATAASEEQKRFNREQDKLDKEFTKQINKLEVAEKVTIESQENWTRLFAVLLPPLPALAIGIGVVLVRLSRQAKARR